MIKYDVGRIIFSSNELTFQLYILIDSQNIFLNFHSEKEINEYIECLNDDRFVDIVHGFQNVETILRCISKNHFINRMINFKNNITFLSKYIDSNKLNLINTYGESYIIPFNVDKVELLHISPIIMFFNNLETEINTWVFKFYSKKNNTLDAVQFFIDKISDVLINKISEYKMFVNDETIFETYFIISQNNSKFFGFIDNENVSNPQYIADVSTKNLHNFLFFYKKILEKN
jgi:hypothetical protein